LRLREQLRQLQGELAGANSLLAACQADAAQQLLREAVEDPLLWALVAWAALSVLVWLWRLGWMLCGFTTAFPLDRYSYNLN
jgi:hypothetical protein